MTYRLELGQDLDESLYLELAIRNINTGTLISGEGIDHRLVVFGDAEDYGRFGRYGQVVASNANGMITAPAPGIVAINVPTYSLLFGGNPTCCETPGANPPWPTSAPPPSGPAPPPQPALGGGPPPPAYGAPCPPPYAPFFSPDIKRAFLFKLLAVPLAQPWFVKTLIKGTISFGGTMPSPQLTLNCYPLYPNSPTAAVLSCEVAQLKQQLAQLGLYDQVEQGLAGTTDPASISWNSGGLMTLGGPLANKISVILGTAPGQPLDLTNLMTAAARTNV